MLLKNLCKDKSYACDMFFSDAQGLGKLKLNKL
jgi:hypothetical protein